MYHNQQRNKGIQILPYPCISRFKVLHFYIQLSPEYALLVERLKNGEKLLDIGCGLGQDIRRLVSDGVPSENIYGLELERGFVDLGFELFRDRATLKTKFIINDFLKPSPEVESLKGKINIIHAGLFLHLWDWEGQVNATKRLVEILSPEKGSVVTGVQYARVESGIWDWKNSSDQNSPKMFVQSTETWKKLWEQVGSETQTLWSVTTQLEFPEEFHALPNDNVGG